jgi:hypothetical protein
MRPVLQTPFILRDMASQLRLIDEARRDWHLDPHTREVGRQGVATAREALRQAAVRAAQRSSGQAA